MLRAKNNERHAGFEIEYVDVSILDSIQLLHTLFSGKVNKEHAYKYYLDETQYGRFTVEHDAEILKHLATQSKENMKENQFDFHQVASDALLSALDSIMPLEIVTPPLKFHQISIVDQIVNGLREKGAQDTKKNILAAFGLHINIEAPDYDAQTILGFMRAYILLSDWLKDEMNIDKTRLLSRFINEFPKKYKILILQPEYIPSINQLIDDYLQHNPTRNRALDMLPLFKFIDQDRVTQQVTDQRIKARPALHYRLPNSHFSDQQWSVTKEWQRWLMVEKLANNPELLAMMIKNYLELATKKIFFVNTWVERTQDYIKSL